MKAALFDMDGVLCNTQQYHYSCYEDIAKKHYNVILDSSIKHKLEGVLREEGVKIFCKAVGIQATDENIKFISELKNKNYLEKIEANKDSLLNDGAVCLLKRLKDNGVKTALVSASRNARYIAKLTKIDQYFDYMVDSSKIEKGKPNPAIFLMAAAHLAVKPKDCVVYEDAVNGIQAANDCNMYSVAMNVDFSKVVFTYKNKIADRYITSLTDPLCYKGLYENIYDNGEDLSLYIFDAGNVVLDNIHCFNDIFSQYNFTTEQKNEFIKDYSLYVAPLMDGNITPDFFFEHINKTMNINITGDPLYDHFHPVFNKPIVELIKSLRKSGKRVVLGSNTFAPHVKTMKEIGLFDLFDEVYLSNEIGHYKPNPSYFRYILEKENEKADKAYFIDDLDDNIATAAALGINTLHYIGENKDLKLKKAFGRFI